jgi:hypothetical protein
MASTPTTVVVNLTVCETGAAPKFATEVTVLMVSKISPIFMLTG